LRETVAEVARPGISSARAAPWQIFDAIETVGPPTLPCWSRRKRHGKELVARAIHQPAREDFTLGRHSLRRSDGDGSGKRTFRP